MFREPRAPTFEDFLRFVASRHALPQQCASPPDRLAAAARDSHEALGEPADPSRPPFGIEILELLVASSEGAARPAELVTVRGFRVRLDYRDGADSEPSSICVLVQCPEELIAGVQGRTAWIWNGAERFELGQFDADGKAIGNLPAGVEITLNDFTTGRIKLEAPDAPHD